MKVAFSIAGSLVLLAGAVLLSATWVVVDVCQSDTDESHIVVPVPLSLARAALYFVDDDHTRIECAELARYHSSVEEIVRQLGDLPDAELVRVSDPEQEVVISKIGDSLDIAVSCLDEQVRVRLPISRLEDLLSYYDGEAFAVSDVLDVLTAAPRGDLVHVRDEDQEVRIRIW